MAQGRRADRAEAGKEENLSGAPEGAPATLRGVLWMSGAVLSFCAMAVAARQLLGHMGTFEILFFRTGVAWLIVVALAMRTGFATLRTRRIGLHLWRNLIPLGGQSSWVYSLGLLPLAMVFAIEFTTPIWTALLAAMFLGERLTAVRLTAIALGFGGVLVILRPGVAILDPAAFAALGAAFGYACSYIFTKDLVATDRPITILLWMNAIQLPLALAASASIWVAPSPALWPWVAVTGAVGLTSHYCLSRALQYGEATVVTPIDFLRLPLAAAVAWMLYGERVDPWVFVGAAIIFGGVWLNLRRG